MKFNFNTLIIAITVAVVLFGITTFIQKKLLKNENMIEIVTVKEDIDKNVELNEEMLKLSQVPESIGQNPKLIKNIEIIKSKVTKYPLFEGQFLYEDMIIEKSQLNKMIVEPGRQRISIKIKEIQDALSYKITEGDKVNLYFIGRYENVIDSVNGSQIYPILTKENGYCVVKILENEAILGTFDSDGNLIEYDSENKAIDTVMFSLPEEKIKLIYSLTPNGYFSITQGN